MTGLGAMIRRNCKLFFKDKGMFFTSLITPVILLVLYATFLAKIYRDSFASALPQGVLISANLIDATVGAQLVSSLLAVSCVTVAFCSNLLMVGDKASGAIRDFELTPVKRGAIALGYYLASSLCTLIVALTAFGASLIYIAAVGWYFSLSDLLLSLLDVILLTLFGVGLSSAIHFFLSTSGQASAVGTIVSAGYGFLCGAYMPISNFAQGLQNVLMFFPSTYGTSLIREHLMAGVFAEMSKEGFPEEVVEGIKDSIDANIYFFNTKVEVWVKYLVIGGSAVLFTALFVLFRVLASKRKKKENR